MSDSLESNFCAKTKVNINFKATPRIVREKRGSGVPLAFQGLKGVGEVVLNSLYENCKCRCGELC